jgi:acyl carrier protein
MAEANKEQELAQIRSKLKELLARDLSLQDLKPEDIADDAPLFGDGLGLDSLDAVEIVVLLQRHFGVEVKDMDVGRKLFQSVDTLANYVYEKRATAP